MIGATAKADQFRDRSGSESTKGSRKGFTFLDEGINPLAVLSDSDRLHNERAALIARQACLSIEIRALSGALSAGHGIRSKELFDVGVRRNRAKRELTMISLRLSEIKAVWSSRIPDNAIPQAFVDVCRETMTAAQFKIVMQQARERAASQASDPAEP